MKIKSIRQADLTSDCWMIQFQGIEACMDCEFRGTDDCGGVEILDRMTRGEYPLNGLPDQVGMEGSKEVFEDEYEVDLIASGYEWMCPVCGCLNKEIEILELVCCDQCEQECGVYDHFHAYKG